MTAAATKKTGATPLSPRLVAKTLLQYKSERKSGFLRVKQGDGEIAVTLADGVAVNARSSLRQHTLGAYLGAIERLSSEQLLAVDQLMRQERIRFGEAATKLGVIKASEVVDLLRGAMRNRIAYVATWNNGEMLFIENSERALSDSLAEIDVFDAIVLGCIAHTDIAEAVAELGQQRYKFACPSPSFELRASAFVKLAPNTCVIETLRHSPRLVDLLSELQGQGEQGIRELYAAWAAELVSFEDGPRSEKFVVPQELERPAASPVASPVAVSGDSVTEQICAEYLRCQGVTFYELLGLEQNTSREQIAQAGQAFAAKLVEFEANVGTHAVARERLAQLKRWVLRAITVLADDNERQKYDVGLRSWDTTVPAGLDNAEAELAFRRGEQFLNDGNLDLAISELNKAIGHCPESPEYAALLGWIETRRATQDLLRGYERLQSVCERSPHTASAHCYLGLLFLERNETGLATASLRRALELDPNHELAKAALSNVEGSNQGLFSELFGDSPTTGH